MASTSIKLNSSNKSSFLYTPTNSSNKNVLYFKVSDIIKEVSHRKIKTFSSKNYSSNSLSGLLIQPRTSHQAQTRNKKSHNNSAVQLNCFSDRIKEHDNYKQMLKLEKISQAMSMKLIKGIKNATTKVLKNINTKKNFRKLIMNNFGVNGKPEDMNEGVERSKLYYNKEVEIMNGERDRDILKEYFNKKYSDIKLEKQAASKEMKKRLKESFSKKENNKKDQSIVHINLQNKYDESMKEYEEYRLKNNIKLSNKIAGEIADLNCKGYTQWYDKDGNILRGRTIINYSNWERKIRVFNINKYSFDWDNDDWGTKNLPQLKKSIKNQDHAWKFNYKWKPKFVKPKLRTTTIDKFRGWSGIYFGVS